MLDLTTGERARTHLNENVTDSADLMQIRPCDRFVISEYCGIHDEATIEKRMKK